MYTCNPTSHGRHHDQRTQDLPRPSTSWVRHPPYRVTICAPRAYYNSPTTAINIFGSPLPEEPSHVHPSLLRSLAIEQIIYFHSITFPFVRVFSTHPKNILHQQIGGRTPSSKCSFLSTTNGRIENYPVEHQ